MSASRDPAASYPPVPAVDTLGPQAVFDRDGTASWTDRPGREAEGVRFKDRFPFRLQGQFDQTLHDPVFQGRDAQRA